jgi:hypothetical protein
VQLIVLITDGATTEGPRGSDLTAFVVDSLQKMEAARRPLIGVVMVGNEHSRVSETIASMVTDSETGAKSRFYYSSDSFDASDVIYDLLDKACGQKEEDPQIDCKLWKSNAQCLFSTTYSGPDDAPCGLLQSAAAASWTRPSCCSRTERVVHVMQAGESLASITRKYCITMEEFIEDNSGRVTSAAYVTPMTRFNIPPPRDLCNPSRKFVDCAQRCCEPNPPSCDDVPCDKEAGWTQRHPPGTKCTESDPSKCFTFCCKPPEFTPGDCDPPVLKSMFPEPADTKGNCPADFAKTFGILAYNKPRYEQNVHFRSDPKKVAKASGLECQTVTQVIEGETQNVPVIVYTDPLPDWGWFVFSPEYAKVAVPGNVLVLVQSSSAPLGCQNAEPTTDADGNVVCRYKNGKKDELAEWGEWYRGGKKYKNMVDIVVTIRGKRYGYRFPERVRFDVVHNPNIVQENTPYKPPKRKLEKERQVTKPVRRVVPFGSLDWYPVRELYKDNSFVLVGKPVSLGSLLRKGESPSQLLVRAEYVTGDWGFKRVPEQHTIYSAEVCPEDKIIESDTKCLEYFDDKCTGHNMEKRAENRNRHCLDDTAVSLAKCVCPSNAAYAAKLKQGLRCESAFIGRGMTLACVSQCLKEASWITSKCESFDPESWSCKTMCCKRLEEKLCENHKCSDKTRFKSPLPRLCGANCQETCCDPEKEEPQEA